MLTNESLFAKWPLTYELSLDLLVGLVHGSRPVQLVVEQPQVLARLIAKLRMIWSLLWPKKIPYCMSQEKKWKINVSKKGMKCGSVKVQRSSSVGYNEAQ